MLRLFTLIGLIVTYFAAAPAAAEDRLALVIGNGGYRNISRLDNPANDARLMERTLREAGFRVTTIVDADREAMRRAVEQFGRDIRAARPGSLALFYFAGHGVRSDGFNYLVPVDVNIRTERDIARETVAAEWVIEHIEAPGITSVMVLDACRNNPFEGGRAGTIPESGDGLARMTAKNSNLIAYATGPGDVALDGNGNNSPYTAALARAIVTPNLDVEAIFAQVREEVTRATAGQQIPWESSSLRAAVYIQPQGAVTGTAAPQDEPLDAPQLQLAVAFRSGRGGWGVLDCNEIFDFAPVSLASDSESARRIAAINASRDLALEFTTRQTENGIEFGVAPVAAGTSGSPITSSLAEITSGREHALYSHVRHPDFFACGPMTVYIRRLR